MVNSRLLGVEYRTDSVGVEPVVNRQLLERLLLRYYDSRSRFDYEPPVGQRLINRPTLKHRPMSGR